MDMRRNLLWVDCTGGATVGVAMLLLAGWLSRWYQLPRDLLILMGIANLLYGSYSFSLVLRRERPMPLIGVLVVANLAWAVACLRWAVVFRESANWLGIAHLVVETLFVGGLACLEWRWRELLRQA